MAPLVTPAPPTRVVVPVTIPEPLEAAPLPQPPSALPPRSAQPPAPRPERPAAAAASPAPVSAPTEQAAAPLILQTTANPTEVGQRADALIAMARRDLATLNPAQLSANARAQYDSATGFVRQAEDALKFKNVVLARELAEKAAALASQLKR
jgi:hypothetical protein